MRNLCPLDIKQTVLKTEFHKLSLYAKQLNFDLCPILPGFAMMPHTLIRTKQEALDCLRETLSLYNQGQL